MPSFDSAIRDFWHGILLGKKCPVAFYTPKERKALAAEVEFAAKKYRATNPAKADLLRRYFQSINAYISAKNILPNGKIAAKNIMPQFLRLLYCGDSAPAFWVYFRRKYRLPIRPSPSAFWDYFEEFQPKRMEIAGWLGQHAKGKILDIGSGAHSYIPVAVALDASAKALAKNKMAKRRIAFDINKKTRLPFKSKSFGTIMLNSILAYTAKPIHLLSECRRILKPGGVLLITNAPVSPFHPAKYFGKSKISAKALAAWLNKVGFGFRCERGPGALLSVSGAAGQKTTYKISSRPNYSVGLVAQR